MPRKTPTSASTVQNRNNQRLSRARRRELVEDLQRRLREYERRGVEASLEMQRAARAVALENQRLRSLLAARGVSHDEIAAHLAAPDDVRDGPGRAGGSVRIAPRPAAGPAPFRAAVHHLPSPPISAASSPYPALPGRASPDSAPPVSAAADSATKDARQEPGQEEPCQTPWRAVRDQCCTPQLIDNVPWQDASSILPPVPDCYCPPLSPRLVPGPTSTLETSCEAAARILAGIRGHPDSARDLSALGCTGTGDCMVSNARLFQLMNEMG